MQLMQFDMVQKICKWLMFFLHNNYGSIVWYLISFPFPLFLNELILNRWMRNQSMHIFLE